MASAPRPMSRGRLQQRKPHVVARDEREERGVEPVQRTAVGAEERARVLRARVALDRRLEQVADRRGNAHRGDMGAKRFIDFLRTCDVKAKLEPYPSIALGAGEISLYEMMQAYSMFPGRGFNVKPLYITRIEDMNGNVLQTFAPQRKEVISDVTAYSIINMMEGVVQYGTGRRIWNYGVSGEIAGKTGTTNDNSDAWFMGYTPQLLCGVWAGCDDRFIRFNSTAIGQGSSAALPVWAYFYSKASADKNLALDKSSTFAKPDVMENSISYDWINNVPNELGAEGQDVGNGNSADYGDDVLPSTKPEDIKPESQLPDTSKKNKDKDVPQPKAVMPKKPGTK